MPQMKPSMWTLILIMISSMIFSMINMIHPMSLQKIKKNQIKNKLMVYKNKWMLKQH